MRVATHAQLRSFVEQFGLEFYPLGGDPQVLADFAVQSKGVQKHVMAAIRTHCMQCCQDKVFCYSSY